LNSTLEHVEFAEKGTQGELIEDEEGRKKERIEGEGVSGNIFEINEE